ncbi:MAG TPA: NAD-dependent epimerase/dehydratase family protein, partial [Caldimonas sp.]|nr:NAD-dependent epimerase/dehydratase family protein [Caldimonas sp.]
MPRALVTGATGLVGSHVVDQLLAQGWTVRALVRRPEPELAARGVDLAVGDVRDAGSFARAAEGNDVLFHTAAVVTSGGGWEAFRRPNVDGTRNAIAAAARAGARLLHVSS